MAARALHISCLVFLLTFVVARLHASYQNIHGRARVEQGREVNRIGRERKGNLSEVGGGDRRGRRGAPLDLLGGRLLAARQEQRSRCQCHPDCRLSPHYWSRTSPAFGCSIKQD